MNTLSSYLFRAAALALALPVLSMCAVIQINGVCVDGSCTPVPVSYGSSMSGSSSNGVSSGTDPFSVTSTYSVGTTSSGGTYIDFYPVVSYTGSGPSTGAMDVVTFDLLASIQDTGASNWDGTYHETIPLIVADHSTVAGQLCVGIPGSSTCLTGATSIGLIGPYGEGTYNPPTKYLSVSNLNGDTLDYDYQFTFDFYSGTMPGATDSSPAVPEPAQMIPAALSLVGFGLVALRRHKK
jgi:hypothetical protein